MDKSVKFASLSNILSQPIDQDLPFDAYNRKVTMKEVICAFCQISLCSKAEYQRHRRAMHFRKRAPPGFQLEFKDFEDRDRVREIIDEKEGQFLCIMEDSEDVEWHKLGPTHPLIGEFQKRREALMMSEHDGPVEIPEAELSEFMSNEWEDI